MPLPSKLLLFSVCALSLILASCGSSPKVADNSLADKYQNTQSDIDVQYAVFHSSDDSSRFYVRVDSENLLYARRGGKESTAILRIEIQPFDVTGQNVKELDSKSFRILDKNQSKENKLLVASTSLALPFGKKYRLKITARDMNKGTSQSAILELDKENYSDRHNFILSETDAPIPLFNDRIEPHHSYLLKTNISSPKVIVGHYYNRDFPLPPPPFAIYNPDPFDYTPDSIFTLIVDSLHSAIFESTDTGFYHFQFDTLQKDGFSAFISTDDFPEVKTVSEMINPFRYLVGSKDYEDVSESQYPKSKIESFWIEWAGSRDRARKSIQAYYERVEDANELFSSYVEGWKSDRGLVYIIYGKPNKAYREGQVETWIYGEENNPLSITFHFIKVINPFTENDYRLNREEMYKPSWYRAVNIWRDGRIY